MDYHKATGCIVVALMVTVACCSSLRSNNEIRESEFSKEKSTAQLPRDVDVDRRSVVTEFDCYDQRRNCFHYGKKGCSKKNIYTGSQSYTLFGTKCLKWSLKQKYSNLPENYCRNPDGSDGPWCYTTNPGRVYNFCFMDCDADQCFDSKRGCFHYGKDRCRKTYVYNGTRSYTFDGIKCKDWSSVGATYDSTPKNYCRIPYNGMDAPWCYTPKPILGKNWDYCLTDCSVDNCYDSRRNCFHYGWTECMKRYLYNGTRSYTFDGYKCQEWSTKENKFSYLAKNYCRNPSGGRAPWCYVTKSIANDDWDYCLTDCSVDYCYDSTRNCYHYGYAGCTTSYMYNGTRSYTFDGIECLEWSTKWNNVSYLVKNYCRNPSGERGPWCYAKKSIGKFNWDYCLPDCTAEDCFMYNGLRQCYSREEKCQKRYVYNGSRNFNLDQHRCAKWSLVSTDYKYLPGSFCRNPNKRKAPWCYTEGQKEKWRYCFEEECHVGPCYDVSRQCFHYEKPECKKIDSYTGTRSYTVSGLNCAEWSSSPAITDVEKKNLLKNFCRNPRQKEGPWCYTEGSKFDYCLEACTNDKCYDRSLDCYHYGKAGCSDAYSYIGKRSYSVNGHECHNWNRFSETTWMAGNLCRDPTGKKKGPYCLISWDRYEWDYCFKDCNEGKCYDSENDCFHGEKPECKAPYSYLGNKDHTTDGTKCQAWLTHGDSSPRNYCRLRYGEQIGIRGPWCYINVNGLKKEFCMLDCVEMLSTGTEYSCGLYETRASCQGKAGYCTHRHKHFKIQKARGRCEQLNSSWYHCICEEYIGAAAPFSIRPFL